MRNILNGAVIFITVIAVLVGVFFAFNAYIYHEKQGGSERASLSGTIVCLPHKGSGPSTKECAAGLKTDAGVHYALEFVLTSEALPNFQNGDRMTANGVVIVGEAVPKNLQKYDIHGLFSITDSITIVPS